MRNVLLLADVLIRQSWRWNLASRTKTLWNGKEVRLGRAYSREEQFAIGFKKERRGAWRGPCAV
jgi:hypothetical protein